MSVSRGKEIAEDENHAAEDLRPVLAAELATKNTPFTKNAGVQELVSACVEQSAS